jgi:hypothetical protein
MNDSPYAVAAVDLLNAGWHGVLPLPAKAKKYPPTGYTGSTGVDPSGADVYTWAEQHDGNVALRMPPDVIGVDVDAYGEKQGAATMSKSRIAWGPLPPTWRMTSRDDGISGILLYRVPIDLAWPGEVGPGVEIIQRHHRYAVAPPSIHPEGRRYRWINPDGAVSITPPRPEDLPDLPSAWVDGLTGGEAVQIANRGGTNYQQAVTWLACRTAPTAKPCRRMAEVADAAAQAMKGNAHNTARNALATAARLAEGGHRGGVSSATALKVMFIAEATDPRRAAGGMAVRTKTEAEREWVDLLTSAVDLVIHNPSPGDSCDCDGVLTDWIVGNDRPQEDPPDEPTAPRLERELPDGFTDGAVFIFGQPAVEPIWGDGDMVLWSRGEACQIAGPPGVGKTTLTGQIVREIIGLGQGDLLGLPIRSVERVLYLAMDRPRQIARSLRRHFRPEDAAVLADKLLVWEGPPPQDVAKNPELLKVMATLVGADVIVIDSLKDAVVGLTDDAVAAGYNRARQTALAAGIDVLELHHMRKAGDNGSKPNTLADVYGSAWITAGIGSCIVLWGKAGDPLVDLLHLKTPLDDCGPIRLIHDHHRGVTGILDDTDPLSVAHGFGSDWFTAKDYAARLMETEDPGKSDVEKSRRRLAKMADDGLLEMDKAPAIGGRGHASRWRVVSHGSSRGGHAGQNESHAEHVTESHESHEQVTDGRGSIKTPPANPHADAMTLGITPTCYRCNKDLPAAMSAMRSEDWLCSTCAKDWA